MPPLGGHTLQSTAILPPEWASSPPPRESCDELCLFFTNKAVLPALLARKPVTIFSGATWHLFDWARRGCPFAKHLTKWFPGLNPWDHLDITLERVKHRQGMPEEAQLFEMTADTKYKSRYIEIVTDQYDPAGSYLVARPMSPDPLSPQNVAFVSEWLNCCTRQTESHGNCHKPDLTRTRLPTRVIRVPQPGEKSRLYIAEKDEVGKYAALSYCWGGPQLHTTCTENLIEYTRELPALPATIIDAIRLSQELSIPYLWVDSLCIVQDSEEDKIWEISNMSRIYKDSWVTISAARASACHQGFLGVQEITAERTASSITVPMACPDGSTGSATLRCARLDYLKSTQIAVNSRAWTYQETFVSPRTISYYDDSIELKCLSGIKNSDDLKSTELAMRHIINGGNPPHMRQSILPSYFYLEHGCTNKLLPTPEAQELGQLWREIVFSYSKSILSDLNDKLPAISAIACEFSRVSDPGNTYLAGLWRRTLHRDLLWTRENIEWWQFSKRTGDSFSGYTIPTWSWASIPLGQTSLSTFYGDFGTVLSPRVEILDCNVNLTSPEAPFGCVNGGRLVIRGPVKSVTTADAWGMFGSEGLAQLTYARDVGRFWDDYRRGAYPPPNDIASTSKGVQRLASGNRKGPLEWGIPSNHRTLWLLGLAKEREDSRWERYPENCGLVLIEADEGSINKSGESINSVCYQRVGVFRISKEYIYAAARLRAEMETLVERWGEKYEMRTMTII